MGLVGFNKLQVSRFFSKLMERGTFSSSRILNGDETEVGRNPGLRVSVYAAVSLALDEDGKKGFFCAGIYPKQREYPN
jgi:hypothetical protein